jgi:hypothetical protein
MNSRLRGIAAVLLSGIWVNASEFLRNEVFLKAYWVGHYHSLGMVFPSEPKNGILWVIWGFLFAFAIYLLSRKFNLFNTALLSWFLAFVLMWIVALNLKVLPVAILIYAVPLSLLESFIGTYICIKISPPPKTGRS